MKKRGGYSNHLPLTPMKFDGEGVGTSGVELQEVAGQAGGYSNHLPLNPENYDGAGVGTSGVAVQFEAGQAGGKKRRKKGKKSRSKKGGTCPDGGVEC